MSLEEDFEMAKIFALMERAKDRQRRHDELMNIVKEKYPEIYELLRYFFQERDWK